MSHFSLTRPTWVSGTVLNAFEMASIDAKTFAAINGDGGGTYAPSSAITIGGAGVTIDPMVGVSRVTGVLGIDGGEFHVLPGATGVFQGLAVYVSGSATAVSSGASWTFDAGATLHVNSDATFTGAINAVFIGVTNTQISDSLYTGPDSVANINGSLTVSGPTNIYGNAGFHGGNTFIGPIDAQDAIINGHLTTNGPVSVQNVATCGSIGRVVRPAVVTAAGGVQTISPTVSNVYVALNLTGDLTLQISDTGAVDGDELFISTKSAIHYMLVYGPGSVLLTQLNNTIGLKQAAFLKRIAGTWYMLTEVSS